MNPQELGQDAGRLLAYGLNPRVRPAQDPTYAHLLRRFRADPDMRTLTAAVAEGLGLLVLDVTERGIVLGAVDDGPFALRLRSYRQNLSVEERLSHGVIQLAIAAWCFPTAAELADADSVVVRVSVNGLVRYLRELCQELEARAALDPEAGTPELQEAWRAILSRPETRETPDARRTAGSLAGMVAYALETLAEGGLMSRASDDEGGTYNALSAYRVHVRELAAHRAFDLVQRAGRGVER